MFDTIVAAPPDPILGLTEAFKKDPSLMRLRAHFSAISGWLLQHTVLLSLVIICGSAGTKPVAAADLIVRYDQSQLLRLPRPASEVIIGNPSIADATILNTTMVVLTGRSRLIAYIRADVNGEEAVDGFITFVYVDEKGKPRPHEIVINAETPEEIALQERAKNL